MRREPQQDKFLCPKTLSLKFGADEWNRTITMSPSQASETCASTSSATSACKKAKVNIQFAARKRKARNSASGALRRVWFSLSLKR